jgi:polyisoprenoid-binding protein YceI
MKTLSAAIVLALLLVRPGHAASYAIDHEKSSVAFSGTHAGEDFKGVFKTWSAEIEFDATDLAASKIDADFDLSTATTGNAMYDGTLPQADWFNVKEYPKGEFNSRMITANDDGTYQAEGDLTLRGITQPVSFAFRVTDLNQQPVRVQASLPIDRLDYGIGKKSDPAAEWVSQTITVTLDIVAQRQP